MKKREFENIDQLFKQEMNLAGAKAPASVKANIDAQLGARKRKRFWFFLIPALLIAGIAIPFAVNNIGENNNQTENASNSVVINDNSSANNPTTNDEMTSDSNTESTSDLNNGHSQDDVDLVIESENNQTNSNTTNTSNSVFNRSNTTSSTNTSISTSNSTSDNVENNNSTSSTNSNTSINAEIEPEVNEVENESTDTNTDPSEVVENESNDSNVNSENNSNETVDSNTESTNLDSDTTNVIENNVEANNESESNVETTNLDSADVQPNENNEIAEVETDSTNTESTEIDSSSTETADPDHNIEPEEEKYKGWFLTLSGGPKFKRSNVTGNDTSVVYNNVLSDRAGFGVGIDVNYRIQKGFTFGSGLSYASYSENYDYQKSQVMFVDSTVTYTPYIYDSIPDSLGWIYLWDTLENATYNYDTTTLYNQQGQNKTTYLHIPFRVGYQFVLDKWRIDAYAQGRFNLLLSSGATYVLNDQIVTSTLTQSYFDLELGGAAHFNVWKNLYLSGVIRYRPPLRNPYYDPNLFNKMQYVYIGFGASINL